MTDSRTLPVAAAAVTAPAWLPTVAAIAPPLIIGAAAVAGLLWLFSDDDKPKPATAKPDGATPPAPDVAEAAPVPVIVNPSKFQLFAPKVNREDLAAIFAGGKRLARKDAVAALKARGVKQTTAYNALRDGGRFSDLLPVGEDSLLTFKD
jgi:hypothetical protein